MSSKFTHPNRETPFMFPPSIEDWLPEDHLARFIVDIVNRLDLTIIRSNYSEQTKGSNEKANATLKG